MLLSDFFETEYLPRKLIGKSGNSPRLYRLSIAAFSKSLGHPATLADLTNKNVLQLMQDRLDGKFAGRSRATANKDRCQLLAIWRMAARDGVISRWPEVPAFREPERVPKAWTRDDLDKLFRTIDRLSGKIGHVPAALWWRGLVMLALDTAERIGAVLPAEWGWIEGRWVLVPAEVRKGGRRDRKYWISPQTGQILQKIREIPARTNRVFPWKRAPNTIWVEYGKVLKAAGLPHGRQDKFHRLRKTTASVIHAAGMNAQEALDHQHRRTTRRYIDPRFSQAVHASEILAQYLSDPKLRQEDAGGKAAG